MGDNEPIKLEVYKCPLCDKEIRDSYEVAKKHANIPIDKNPLPIGLVFQRFGSGYDIIDSDDRLSEDHGVNHHSISYHFEDNDLGSHRYFLDEAGSSKEIKERFRKGDYTILSKSDFKKVQEHHSDKKLIRTTEGLEKIIKSK